MTAAPPLTSALRCSRHRDQPATLRCAECGRPYCRDCLVSRFVTSRSAVWLCRPCAGVRPAPTVRSWSGGSVPSFPPAARRGAGRWWVALGAAALALCAAYQQGILPL